MNTESFTDFIPISPWCEADKRLWHYCYTNIHTSVIDLGFVGGEWVYEHWWHSPWRSKNPHKQPNHENFLEESFAAELSLSVVCGFP